LRVDKSLLVDDEGSKTTVATVANMTFEASAAARALGLKATRKKSKFKNLANNTVVMEFDAVGDVVRGLRGKFGKFALFFVNELAPEYIGVVWKPSVSGVASFNSLNCQFCEPAKAKAGEGGGGGGAYISINKDDVVEGILKEGEGIFVLQ